MTNPSDSILSSFDGASRCGVAPFEPVPGATASGTAPPSAFRRFLRFFSVRPGRKAMIAPSVRDARLIALSPDFAPWADQGFCEDSPPCFERSTGRLRGSGSGDPQVYGYRAVRQRFDLDGLVDWLRRRYPQSTGHNVEAEAGIAAATVENWLLRRSQPSAAHFVALLHVFGPALLEACMHRPPGWVSMLYSLLDAEVRRLQGSVANPLNPDLLAKAHARIAADIEKAYGVKPAAKPEQPKKAAAAQAQARRPAPPPSLASVPAADIEDTDDGGEFSALDRLADRDRLGYEKALADLRRKSPDAYDRYMAM